MTKLGLFCERLIEAGWLVAVATVPFYFNIFSSRVFEPDKISVLRGLVLVMLLAQVIRWLEGLAWRKKATSGSIPGNGVERVPSEGIGRWWPWWNENRLAFPTLLVAATYLISTIVSVSPSISFWGSYQRLQGTYSMYSYMVLFFLMAANLRRRVQLDRLFNVVLLVSLPISVYGIIQHFRLDPLPWGGDVITRVTSTLGNAIFLPAYLIMVIPIAVYRLIESVSRLGKYRAQEIGTALAGWPRIVVLLGVLIGAIRLLFWFAEWGAKSGSLWWAMLPLVGAFAAIGLLFTVRHPTFLTNLAEVIGYLTLLSLLLWATYLSQSRGPQLGLLAGLACFAIALAIVRRSRLMLASFGFLAVASVAFLIVFNLDRGPLEGLKQVPYVGRLGQLTETDYGTGKVRVLIWQGTLDLLTKLPPVGLEDADPLGKARLLVGYGPESMYVVFNKVYPPDLAHYEARNASPDRNHNDVLDYLVSVGVLGLLAYFLLLAAVAYVLVRHLRAARTLGAQLALVGVLSALVAHFVESLVGIVIAATWTYFWAYLAVVAAGGLFYQQREKLAATARLEPAPAATVVLGKSVSIAPAGPGGSSFRRKGRRDGGSSGPAKVSERAPTVEIDREAAGIPYTGIAFVVLVLALLYLLTRPAVVINDIPLPLYLSFVGLVVAAAAIALSLGSMPKIPFWRVENSWIYAIGTVVVAFLAMVNLNGIAADIFYKRGFGADQQRNFPMSIVTYNEAIALAPDQDFYYLFLGRAYLELAKMTQRPKAEPPFSPTLSSLLNIQYAQLNQLGREDMLRASEIALEQARTLNPLNTDHYANLGRLNRTWAELGDRPRLELADKFYREATTLSPQAAHLFDEWSQVDVQKGALDDALAKTKKAAEIDPEFPLTFIQMGDIYQMKGQLEEALAAHAKVLALDPGPLADARFEQRFEAYNKAGMVDRLSALYAEATKKAPDSAPARAAYGFILSRQGKPREALAEFQANVRLIPNDWIAHRNLVLVYQSLGMIDQAIRSAQDALRFAPQDQRASLQNLINELQKMKQ